MRSPKVPENFVPLVHAGISKDDFDHQVQTLCASDTFDGKKNAKKLLRHLVKESYEGKIPTPRTINRAVFRKPFFHARDNSLVRGETGKLRGLLAKHYRSAQCQASEIRFFIPEKQYVVFAPKAASTEPKALADATARVHAVIIEPAKNAEVYQRVTARGRIDALNPDLRAWLVVRTPCGDLYPQCRVSRKNPEWEQEVRIGLVQWGSNEGAEYEINLVAADADGDAAFYNRIKAPGYDGFGPLLPTDCVVLDAKMVTRRDLRPKPK